MSNNFMYEFLNKISFTRVSGSKEELKCATMIKEEIEKAGGTASIVPFEVTCTNFKEVSLTTSNGNTFEVTGYRCSEETGVEGITAEFYYMESTSEISKMYAKDKIVLVDGYLRKPAYEALLKAGAKAFITYGGDVYDKEADIDVRELREPLYRSGKLPGVHMRTIDAMNLVKENPKEVTIKLLKEEGVCDSRNVISEITGSKYPNEVICFTAHFDSVLFSKGAYDNGAGSVIILELYKYFLANKPSRTLRFIWCGSEERGLLGSKAYVYNLEEEELNKIVLNVNVDVAGTVLGKDSCAIIANNDLVSMVKYLSKEVAFPIEVRQDIYSSDCMPFADKGIPAINFMRFGAPNAAHIHDKYDTMHFISSKSLEHTYNFVKEFATRLQNYIVFPVDKEIPENLVTKVNEYLAKKKEEK